MGEPISGHVYRHQGARGPVSRAKYRLPDGRQVHKTIGPVWTERGRGTSPTRGRDDRPHRGVEGHLRMSNRTKVKLLTVSNGVMARARRVHRLPVNPMTDVEKAAAPKVGGDRGLLAGGDHGLGPRG